MPGVSGVTVVTMLVCFVLFRTRGCGRIVRPAFPAPSDLQLGRTSKQNSRARRGETAKSCFDVIARSEATKQSNFLFRGANSGLLRGACHRARIRAPRWLAMTV